MFKAAIFVEPYSFSGKLPWLLPKILFIIVPHVLANKDDDDDVNEHSKTI